MQTVIRRKSRLNSLPLFDLTSDYTDYPIWF